MFTLLYFIFLILNIFNNHNDSLNISEMRDGSSPESMSLVVILWSSLHIPYLFVQCIELFFSNLPPIHKNSQEHINISKNIFFSPHFLPIPSCISISKSLTILSCASRNLRWQFGHKVSYFLLCLDVKQIRML